MAERVRVLRSTIGAVQRRFAHAVDIMAVTKGFGPEAIEYAVAAGCADVGENYAQEVLAKRETIERCRPRVHFIGRLQTNKVRRLAGLVDVWASVDRESLVDEIAARDPGATVLIQVNSTGETTKGGCEPSAVEGLVDRGRALGLVVDGIMTVGPTGADPGRTSDAFGLTRRLVDDLGLVSCSMGMSSDIELAVALGSTQVRIGTALFGDRPA